MTASSRPDIVPARSRVTRVLEGASLLAVAASVAVTASSWSALPDRVPTHFGAAGHADAFGSKSYVLTPALLALGAYLLFSLVQLVPPRFYNYPTQVTPDNALVQYSLARTCLALVKAAMCVMLACGTWLTVEVALGERDGLGMWFLPGALLATVLPMAWYAAAVYRRRIA
jgi:uncharacterized membrane protein